MRNIEIFEAISALLLADLYEHFPLKINVHPSSLAMKLDDCLWDESTEPVPGYGDIQIEKVIRHKSPVALAKPTIEWLASAGFVSFDRYDRSDFIGVCLTPKGLELIKSDQERANRLVEAAKGIVKDSASDVMKNQLTGVFSEMLSWSIKNSPTIFQTVSRIIES